MKTPKQKKYGLATVLGLMIILTGWNAFSEKGGVVQTIKNATSTFDNGSVESVPPVPEDTVLAQVRYQGGTFRVETRKDKVKRFQCSQCHNNQPVAIANAVETAHGDITLNHGDKVKQLACFTCHDKDNRDVLITEKGTKVDMDHSYQLCGQCHFRQKKDWIGGAHGKRVSWWAGERVVKNCASCHDPHAPRFEKRWPKTYSRPFTE
ncbi:MAG: hypothetical protein JRD49_03930 [Deltaproteobacteria bacterium]|nr:hypothetical protein [Deltaproteobacteria bacterium]MBW2676695.1 hypothetical protein [Deltaproteobacteria bacterium]